MTRAAAAALLAVPVLLAVGCGGEPSALRADGFTPPEAALDAGERRPSSGSPERLPSYELEVGGDQEVTFGVRLRNAGDEPVTVTGVAGDRDVDGYLRPRAMEPPRVELAPGERRDVRVTSDVRCSDVGAAPLQYKRAQLFRVGGREEEVPLGVLLLVACA